MRPLVLFQIRHEKLLLFVFSGVGTLELQAKLAFGAGSQTDRAVACCQVRIA